MSSTYISSDQIWMYPSALRGGTDNTTQTDIYDPQSRIGTESNLNSSVNRLTINGSFVIDSEISSDHTLRFSIHGYYFKANVKSIYEALNAPNEIWAAIKIESIGDTSDAYKIECLIAQDGTAKILDNDSTFMGVKFYDSEPSLSDGEYCLKILVKSGSDYIVPATSYLRYSSDMLSVGGKPLDEILKYDDINGVQMSLDNLNVNNTLNATTTNCNNINGSLSSVVNGIANSAVRLTDSANNAENVGTESRPVYFMDGMPTAINTLAVGYGGTGKSNLNDVKVGSASTSDVAAKWTTSTVGGTSQSGDNTITTCVYVDSGSPVESLSIYASPNAPSNNTGKNGDIWFKYN